MKDEFLSTIMKKRDFNNRPIRIYKDTGKWELEDDPIETQKVTSIITTITENERADVNIYPQYDKEGFCVRIGINEKHLSSHKVTL